MVVGGGSGSGNIISSDSSLYLLVDCDTFVVCGRFYSCVAAGAGFRSTMR